MVSTQIGNTRKLHHKRHKRTQKLNSIENPSGIFCRIRAPFVVLSGKKLRGAEMCVYHSICKTGKNVDMNRELDEKEKMLEIAALFLFGMVLLAAFGKVVIF